MAGILWMGDIESYMDEDFIQRAFLQMGHSCLNVKIVANRSNNSMDVRYGFVDFGDEDIARKVLHHCDQKVIPFTNPPRKFKLNFSTHGRNSDREFSMFVGELSPDVDDLTLYTAFSKKYSSVKAGKVVCDVDGHSRGYGFVRFGNESEYNDALVYMQNYDGIGTRPIRVSVATPRQRRNDDDDRRTTSVSSYTAPSAQSYQQSYQQHYNQYYAQWQQHYSQYYQQPSYAPAATSYPYAAATTYDSTAASQYNVAAVTEVQPSNESSLDDHGADLKLDVEKLNSDLVERANEFYTALDDSRWLPLDGLDPPMLPVK